MNPEPAIGAPDQRRVCPGWGDFSRRHKTCAAPTGLGIYFCLYTPFRFASRWANCCSAPGHTPRGKPPLGVHVAAGSDILRGANLAHQALHLIAMNIDRFCST